MLDICVYSEQRRSHHMYHTGRDLDPNPPHCSHFEVTDCCRSRSEYGDTSQRQASSEFKWQLWECLITSEWRQGGRAKSQLNNPLPCGRADNLRYGWSISVVCVFSCYMYYFYHFCLSVVRVCSGHDSEQGFEHSEFSFYRLWSIFGLHILRISIRLYDFKVKSVIRRIKYFGAKHLTCGLSTIQHVAACGVAESFIRTRKLLAASYCELTLIPPMTSSLQHFASHLLEQAKENSA